MLLGTQPAQGCKPFFEQFNSIYVNTKTTYPLAVNFNATVQKTGCYVCHGTQKGTFNAYGTQVKKVLAKTDVQNTQKIHAALAQLDRVKTNAQDPKSPTFGDRIRQGKLPAGDSVAKPAAKSSSSAPCR
jgi:hypothetical protein